MCVTEVTKFDEFELPWSMCVSLCVDNTNSMIGVRNSVASRFLQKNPEIFISGCLYHLAHIAASNACNGFCKIMKLNIEVFWWTFITGLTKALKEMEVARILRILQSGLFSSCKTFIS